MKSSQEDLQARIKQLENEFNARPALAHTAERLHLLLDAGGAVGTWDWDVQRDRVYSDAKSAELFSIAANDAILGAPLARFMAAIHEDERARISEAIQTAVKRGGDYADEFRVMRAVGPARWVYARGRCYLNGAGAATRFPGVVLDITERKEAEVMLEEKARLAALGADIGAALAQIASLPEALQSCTAAIVKHLGAAFARI